MLFQDAVILGAANEPMPLECTSPAPTSLSPQAFPFCTLERTVSLTICREFGDTSSQYPSVDDFRHSHHLCVWHCFDIVKRVKILIRFNTYSTD